MGTRNARVIRFLLLATAVITAGLALTGCGLFEDLPAFAGPDEEALLSGSPDTGAGSVGARTDATPVDALTDTMWDSLRGCSVPGDCFLRENMQVSCAEGQCVYVCDDGFVDRDEQAATNGCECAIRPEICDGQDNNCDGIIDNAFQGGQIAAGGAHSCAIDATGAVYCWGANNHGQLGLDTTEWHPRPMQLPASVGFQANQISAGETHTCALSTAEGAVWCWGANAYGQSGAGSADDHLAPSEIELPTSPRFIAAGNAHTCVLDAENHLYCWGDNRVGQLGLEKSATPVKTPTAAIPNQTFKTLATGAEHTCAITSNGQINCWGSNLNAQLGMGDLQAYEGPVSPVDLPVDGSFRAIAAGGDLSCALHSYGGVYCWGKTWERPRLVMEMDSEAPDFEYILISVSSNAEFCALNVESGLLRCGGLGAEELPVLGEGILFSALTSRFKHTCALSQAGRVYCWGANLAGQLGNGQQGGWSGAPTEVSCD